jgi:hypothetical protein
LTTGVCVDRVVEDEGDHVRSRGEHVVQAAEANVLREAVAAEYDVDELVEDETKLVQFSDAWVGLAELYAGGGLQEGNELVCGRAEVVADMCGDGLAPGLEQRCKERLRGDELLSEREGTGTLLLVGDELAVGKLGVVLEEGVVERDTAAGVGVAGVGGEWLQSTEHRGASGEVSEQGSARGEWQNGKEEGALTYPEALEIIMRSP